MKVLDLIKTYTIGGGYRWNEPLTEIEQQLQAGGKFYQTGVTMDLIYKGEVILKRDSRGTTYCSGLQYEFWFRCYAHQIDIAVSEMRKCQRLWYNAASNRKGCQDALIAIGQGEIITLEQAIPGDLLQLWRKPTPAFPKGTGHEVVYYGHDAEWLTYFSTQKSTNGIGERKERLSNMSELYFVRPKENSITPTLNT